jgi:hypothetical protein
VGECGCEDKIRGREGERYRHAKIAILKPIYGCVGKCIDSMHRHYDHQRLRRNHPWRSNDKYGRKYTIHQNRCHEDLECEVASEVQLGQQSLLGERVPGPCYLIRPHLHRFQRTDRLGDVGKVPVGMPQPRLHEAGRLFQKEHEPVIRILRKGRH